MKQNKGLTSYPMLKDGINDYKTSNFDMNVAVSLDFKKIKLSIEFLLDNLQLLKDIKEEKLGCVKSFV